MKSFFNRLVSMLIRPVDNEPENAEKKFYCRNPEGITLTEQQLFGISLGLIIAEQNGAYMDSLEVGETNFPQQQMMQRNWRISGREEALTFLEARSTEGHRKHFNQMLDLYASQNIGNEDKDCVSLLHNLEEVCKLKTAKKWFPEKKEMQRIGTDAWDFGRIVFVARVCYSLGYISEAEAWYYIDRMAEMAKKKFSTWEEYAKSYILGRAIWNGDDGEWENVATFAADALTAPESPWLQLKW